MKVMETPLMTCVALLRAELISNKYKAKLKKSSNDTISQTKIS